MRLFTVNKYIVSTAINRESYSFKKAYLNNIEAKMLFSTIEAPWRAKDTRIVKLENRYALANKAGELSRLHKNTSTHLISHCIRREFHKLNAVSCNIQLAPTQAVTWNIRVKH